MSEPTKDEKPIHADPLEGFLSQGIDKFAHLAMTLVVDVVALIVGVAMLWVVVDLFGGLYEVFTGGGMESLLGMVEGALTIFVFIEIFESFLAYMRDKKVSVKLMLELSLIIVLREVWLVAVSHGESIEMLALAALVLAIGAVRVAIGVSERKAVYQPER